MKTEFRLRRLTLQEFDEELIRAWEELEDRALEPNAFLSPHFVIPAIKYLSAKAQPFGLFVEKVSANSSQLVGFVALRLSKPDKYFPLPHLSLGFSEYSFLSGYLVDRAYAAEVMEVIFDYLSKPQGSWHALVARDRAASGALAAIEQNAANAAGMQWFVLREWERAAIRPDELSAIPSQELYSKKMRKTIRRGMTYLEELGPVQSTWSYGASVTPDTVERFLELENMGWKGEQGTSLKSNANDVAFFREMAAGFSQKGRALFAELSVNAEVIASSITLISGDEAIGFKIGWNPKYAQGSPGILNELRWLETENNLPYKFKLLDSGAAETAEYINRLWPHRRAMRSGVFAITTAGKLALPLVRAASALKGYVDKQKVRAQSS